MVIESLSLWDLDRFHHIFWVLYDVPMKPFQIWRVEMVEMMDYPVRWGKNGERYIQNNVVFSLIWKLGMAEIRV